MKLKASLLAISLATMLSGCNGGIESDNSEALVFPSETKNITVQLVPSSIPFRSTEYDFKITNNGDSPIIAGGWKMYVNGSTTLSDDRFEAVASKAGGYYPSEKFKPIAVGESVTFKADVSMLVKGRLVQDYDAVVFSSVAPDGHEQILGEATRLKTSSMMPYVGFLPMIQFPTMDDPVSMLDTFSYQTAEVVSNRVLGSRIVDQGSDSAVTLPTSLVNNEFVPFPKSAVLGSGKLDLSDSNFTIVAGSDLAFEKAFLEDALSTLGYDGTGTTPIGIKLTTDKNASIYDGNNKSGSYKIEIGSDVDGANEIVITGIDSTGVYYGIQSLERLLYSSNNVYPAGSAIQYQTIKDGPNLDRRTFYLDTVRHFSTVDEIKQIIDALSSLKLNVITLGVTNDQAWRIEIPSIPELTQIGAKTGFDYVNSHDPEYNIYHKEKESDKQYTADPMLPPVYFDGAKTMHNYYSKDQLVELIKYANERHMYLNLEINSFGHASALIDILDFTDYKVTDPLDGSGSRSQFGEYPRQNTVNPCVPGSFDFFRDVLIDVKGMYAEADVKMQSIHLGADEVKSTANIASPACKDLGLKQWEDMPADSGDLVKKHQLEEIQHDIQTLYYERMMQTAISVLDKDVTVQFWSDLAAHIDPTVINKDRTEFWAWNSQNVDTTANLKLIGLDAETLIELTGGLLDKEEFFEDPFKKSRLTIESGANFAIAPNNGFYLDMPYVPHNSEFGLATMAYNSDRRVYTLDAFKDSEYRLGEKYKAYSDNVTNMVAPLWTETATTTKSKHHLIFPRVLAFADQAWNFGKERADNIAPAGDKTFSHYVKVLREVELPLLDKLGIEYRVPLAGAQENDGNVIAANLTGDSIFYTTDGTEPKVTIEGGVIKPVGTTQPCYDMSLLPDTAAPFQLGLSVCTSLSGTKGAKFIAVDKSGRSSGVTE